MVIPVSPLWQRRGISDIIISISYENFGLLWTLKMSRNLTIILFLLCVALLNTSVCADTEAPTKLFPLPLAEADEVISLWLRNSGFIVSRSSLETGKIELHAVSGTNNWQIFLKQHSALATEVQAVSTEQQSGLMVYGRLWDHVSEYIKQPSQGHITEIKGLDHDVPLAVMSRKKSVVCIKAKTEDREVQYSGFIVDDEGLILSTAHDLKDCRDVTVSLHDGTEVKGHIVKIDHHRDLSLISIDAKLDAFISLTGGRTLIHMDERLYSIGCPVNQRGAVFPGVIDGPQRRANGQIFWQVDMKVYPGSSGSPVFDVRGVLVAVVKGRFRGTDSVGFLIPLGTVIEFLNEKQ